MKNPKLDINYIITRLPIIKNTIDVFGLDINVFITILSVIILDHIDKSEIPKYAAVVKSVFGIKDEDSYAKQQEISDYIYDNMKEVFNAYREKINNEH